MEKKRKLIFLEDSKGIVKTKDKIGNLFVVSEEIKEGDWFIYDNKLYNEFKTSLTPKNTIFIRLYPNNDLSEQFREVYISYCKKIIATTDLSIAIKEGEYNIGGIKRKIMIPTETIILPQPSIGFINEFIACHNAKSPITQVMVEYEKCNEVNPTLSEFGTILNAGSWNYKLKIKKDNTITIRRAKDSWNRDEVTKLIELAWATASAYGDNTNSANCNDWIEHNL